MRPGELLRRVGLRPKKGYQLRRKPRKPDDRVTPEMAAYVFQRDGWRCVASRFDIGHKCEGRLTLEHVPSAGHNAMGKRAPSDRAHLVAACMGAQQGWCLTHRDDERAWLGAVEPEATDGVPR